MATTDQPDAILCLTTCPDETVGTELAEALVGRRLAACVNVIPGLRSYYRWQGEVENAAECLLLIKTRASQAAKLRDVLLELHPYELPEFIEVPIQGGHQAYLHWINENS